MVRLLASGTIEHSGSISADGAPSGASGAANYNITLVADAASANVTPGRASSWGVVRTGMDDNETGKGDHRHLGASESAYRFVSIEALMEDFLADVEKRRAK